MARARPTSSSQVGRTEQSCGLSGWQSIERCTQARPNGARAWGPTLHGSRLGGAQEHVAAVPGSNSACLDFGGDRRRSRGRRDGSRSLDRDARACCPGSSCSRQWLLETLEPSPPFRAFARARTLETFRESANEALGPSMDECANGPHSRERTPFIRQRRTWEVLEAPHLVEAEAARIRTAGTAGMLRAAATPRERPKARKGRRAQVVATRQTRRERRSEPVLPNVLMLC